MKFPVDSYEIRARYAPGLLLALPVLLTFWTCFPHEIEVMAKLLSGVLSGTIWYALSVVVRALGKRLEPKLWEHWGGAPSTILVSWKNARLGDELKAKYHKMVEQELNLPMPTREKEETDPEKGAKLIEQAFVRVKGIIRIEDKEGLWSIADAEYGFARNLYGSRLLWLIFSLSMTAVSLGFLWKRYSNLILIGFVFNSSILIGSFVFGWLILPKLTKQIGFRYAEHAWESFCNIAEKKKQKRQ